MDGSIIMLIMLWLEEKIWFFSSGIKTNYQFRKRIKLSFLNGNILYIMLFVLLTMILLHIWYQEFHINGILIEPMLPLSNQDITSLKPYFILLHILGKKYIDPNKLRFGSLRFILFTILQCERLVCFHGPSIFYYW